MNINENYKQQIKITNPQFYKDGLEPYPICQPLDEWINNELSKVKNRSIRWLSETYFHRQEARAAYIDNSYMFTPADGIITNIHKNIGVNEPFIEVKGVNFTLKDLCQNPSMKGRYMTIVVFMSFYSQHLNYIPYSGLRTWEELPPITTYNKPMLAMEKSILNGAINPALEVNYLQNNGRKISTIYNQGMDLEYKVLQISDIDVDTITEFKQNDGFSSTFFKQNDCFGKIQYGSSCILVIPIENKKTYSLDLMPYINLGTVVKCRRTPLVKINWK